MELDTTMRMILQVPIWAQRVIYIQGSCLKDGDLSRARMSDAKACFVLAARNYADKAAAVFFFLWFYFGFIETALILIATPGGVGGIYCSPSKTGRTYDTPFVGRQGLRPDRTPIRSNISAGKQTARKIRRVCRVRRRAQVRLTRQQLHVSWSFDSGHSSVAHQ